MAMVGLGVFGLCLWLGANALVALGGALGGGVMAGLVLGRDALSPGVRQTAMTIVPWGVLLEPQGDVRVLRWPAVRAINVYASHARNGGTPTVVATAVEVRTAHETFSGQRAGAAGLEALTVNLDRYAEEAGRPVAGDLEGEAPCGDGATEPVIEELLRAAKALCTTAQGASRLLLPPGGYRRISNGGVGPETVSLLRGTLAAGLESAADPRALAALVAGRLGATALLPELLRITVSPHPVVAAVARAAALRLGAPPNRAGSIEELSCFLFEEDSALLARWAEEAGIS
jgi:hypothetical protein